MKIALSTILKVSIKSTSYLIEKKYKEHYFMNTYILSLAAGCALLLSFVLGVIVTDRIYQRVYDRSGERDFRLPFRETEVPEVSG